MDKDVILRLSHVLNVVTIVFYIGRWWRQL
jgi:hypothetical protein